MKLPQGGSKRPLRRTRGPAWARQRGARPVSRGSTPKWWAPQRAPRQAGGARLPPSCLSREWRGGLLRSKRRGRRPVGERLQRPREVWLGCRRGALSAILETRRTWCLFQTARYAPGASYDVFQRRLCERHGWRKRPGTSIHPSFWTGLFGAGIPQGIFFEGEFCA